MRFGLPKWTHEAFVGEHLWSVCAKNARVRAKTTEITIYLPVVTMYANIFDFGTLFFRFLVIWGDFGQPFGHQNASKI